MKNLLIHDDQISLEYAVIEGDDFKELIYAQQKEVGQSIDGIDDKGNALKLKIDSIIDGRIVAQILEIVPPARKSPEKP